MSTPARLTPFVKQCFVTAAVCCNIVGNACTVGFPAVLLPQLRQAGSGIVLSQGQASWLTSAMALAAMLGALIAINIMARLGRRPANIVVCIPAIIGWVVTFFANGFTMLLIGRIQQSLSLGISLAIRSVILGEYTSPKNRGIFITAAFLSQAFGIFFVHLVGTLIGWRITALVCMSFPIIALVMTAFCPESPMHLVSKAKYNEGRDAFHWLRGDDEEDEINEMIRAKIDFDREDRVALKEKLNAIKKKEVFKPILIMIHAHAMMQVAGGVIMASHSSEIIGLISDKNHAYIWMIALDGQRIISTCIAIYFLHKFRRRVIMYPVAILCILSHVAIAGYLCAKNTGLRYDATWIGILLLNIQMFSIAFLVPLPNMLTGDLFQKHRNVGNTISIVAGAVTAFLVLKFLPALVNVIGLRGTYFVYAGVLTYTLVVVGILLPETKGKPWQQIEDELRGNALKPEELEIRQSLQTIPSKMSAMPMPSVIAFG